MPTTWSDALYSGPPESPAWIAASVSISPASVIEPPPDSSLTVIVRRRATTTPAAALGVPPTPPALPTPVTESPTDTAGSEAMSAVARPEAPESGRTAMSAVTSYPTTLAEYVRTVLTKVTLMLVAPSMTWLLVSISPEEVRTRPVPAARSPA